MDWNKIHDWMDKFHSDVVESKREIRGRTFMGCHLETWERGNIHVVLETAPKGESVDERLFSTVYEHQTYEVEIPFDRFLNIMAGKDEIRDDEWVVHAESQVPTALQLYNPNDDTDFDEGWQGA